MNGPEHYRAAERLADQANHFTYGDGADPVTGAALAAEAQVHATLALAAATALNDSQGGMTIRDRREWLNMAGAPKPAEERETAQCANCHSGLNKDYGRWQHDDNGDEMCDPDVSQRYAEPLTEEGDRG